MTDVGCYAGFLGGVAVGVLGGGARGGRGGEDGRCGMKAEGASKMRGGSGRGRRNNAKEHEAERRA